MKKLFLFTACILIFLSQSLFAADKNWEVEIRKDFKSTDFYNKIYQVPVSNVKRELVDKYLWPISENLENVKRIIGIKFLKYRKANCPVIYFMPQNDTPKIYSGYKVEKNGKTKCEFKEIFYFPFNRDIVIVHDPDRIKVGSVTQDDHTENSYYVRDNKMSLEFNNNIGENGITDPNFGLSLDREIPSKSTTFIEVENENDSTDPRNRKNIYFPVIKIPKNVFIKYSDGTIKKYPITRIQFTVKALCGAYDFGVTYMVSDPGDDRVYCIPVEGKTNQVCKEAALYAPIVPGEPDPTLVGK